jgi:hypothetical protein
VHHQRYFKIIENIEKMKIFAILEMISQRLRKIMEIIDSLEIK